VPDEALLNSLHYDNALPVDTDGNKAIYDNKKHNLNSKQCQRQKEARKKQQLIRVCSLYILQKTILPYSVCKNYISAKTALRDNMHDNKWLTE